MLMSGIANGRRQQEGKRSDLVSLVHIIRMRQPGQTRFSECPHAARLRIPNCRDALDAGVVEDQRPTSRGLRHRHGQPNGGSFGFRRVIPRKLRNVAAAFRRGTATHLEDYTLVFGMDDREAAHFGHLEHSAQQEVVRNAPSRNGHEPLETRDAATDDFRDLLKAIRRCLPDVHVKREIDARAARGQCESRLQLVR